MTIGKMKKQQQQIKGREEFDLLKETESTKHVSPVSQTSQREEDRSQDPKTSSKFDFNAAVGNDKISPLGAHGYVTWFILRSGVNFITSC